MSTHDGQVGALPEFQEAGGPFPGAGTVPPSRPPWRKGHGEPGDLVLTRSFPTQALRDYLRMLVRTGTPIERIAPELGLTEHHLTKLLRRPFMRDVTADRIAIALGMHPCQLWPEWFPPTPRQAQPSLYGGQVTSRAEASPRVLVAPAVAQPGDGKLRALPAPDTGLPARVPDRAARTTRT